MDNLRDQLAMNAPSLVTDIVMAMCGYSRDADGTLPTNDLECKAFFAVLAMYAYEYADAMIAMRDIANDQEQPKDGKPDL